MKFLSNLVLFAFVFINSNSREVYRPLKINESRVLSYEVNPKKSRLAFYSKDDKGRYFENHGRLHKWLSSRGEKLTFAANGGMFNKDFSPHGLYIENGIQINRADRQKYGYGNFYMQPNGVFLIKKDSTAKILTTDKYKPSRNIRYATQSGPMLLIDGEFHPKFNKGSENVHIRNGVGTLPNGNLLFAISKEKINFYDFAEFFRKKGCKNALYLDGAVSKTFLPSKDWVQEEGTFGIIIAEIE